MKYLVAIPVFLAAMGSLASRGVSGLAGASPAQNLQVIEVTAKKYEYRPGPIHVKRGSKVQLKITASDHAHGFKIGEYPDGADKKGSPGLTFTSPQDCWKIEKGQSETIEFVAQTAGTYTFKCCVHCGIGHKGMKGELIVDP